MRWIQRQLLGNEASAWRVAGSMAMRRSVSFPRGTTVTCVTWRRSPSGTRAASKHYGNEYAHAARLTIPCLMWKSTTKVREQKSPEWLAYRGHRTWWTLGAWTNPQRRRCPAYNPNSGNVGTFFHLNKMKTKRLSNHMSQYCIRNRT